ncbi:hypothetical protein E5Z49_11975 [Listeria monocytogenes]|uniref:Uncharacterized protein n=1 Tax=Listeria monocytogenes TaxID=1639 RepID=A0A823J2K4_LISMN|nr:hypothetical protein [Listeria monocytogenes]EAC8463577.1 hypothetical protein [Listeria monocytogenes]EAD2799980.1 hypothetical protein [Listeria monocytogenes]EAD7213290.1 hypothetical protein [Listeria monocytogenes]EAE1303127.1 hypothetical protein [Listeria monocytogenes]
MSLTLLIKSHKNSTFFIHLVKYLKTAIGNAVRTFICRAAKKKFPIYSHPMLVLICGKDLSSFLFVFVNLSLRKKLPFQSKSELIINDQK